MKLHQTILALALAVTGCSEQADDTAPTTDPYAAAVASASRPAADRERDAARKPAEVLRFSGIGPGDRVLELFAGSGYYTELLAHVVGAEGSVVAHLNTPIRRFAGEDFDVRHADNRLPNVEILMAENNELDLQAESFDAVTLVLNYHDLYWVSDEYGWEKIDVEAFLAEIYEGLKPGGTFLVVDHAAEPGSPRETGGTLHRLAKAHVLADLAAAGFELEGESDVLQSTADDYTKSVFDPEVRGKTDRYVLRFVKPAAGN
ncbi:MAG: methyltransferase domain-containing protein [Woeseiaceae bacterium]|nr:methyltransferase domain-containing protein [Woeseiaceae bacterium]